MTTQPIRFAAVGLNHNHIYGQTKMLLAAGAELAGYVSPEDDLAAEYATSYPQAKRIASYQAVLDDPTIQIVATAAIPSDRASIAIEAMRHGKDVLADKPGLTTLEQLAEVEQVQRETDRIWAVYFSEHFSTPSTVKAGELVAAGAIGRVVQTTGFGPHRAHFSSRPDWFFKRAKYGGILTDIASHQIEQFLFFTGSRSAEVVVSQIGNFAHPEYPELDEYGEVTLRGDGGLGYIRVDWYTPDGLKTWGDGRLFILGTEGYIEIRKYCDIQGRPGTDHLFLADQQGTRYVDCSNVELPFGPQFLNDVRNRTETAIRQERTYLSTRLAIEAQNAARWVEVPREAPVGQGMV